MYFTELLYKLYSGFAMEIGESLAIDIWLVYNVNNYSEPCNPTLHGVI